MEHGYTNETLGDGTTVVKTYAGPDAASRALRERTALTALAGRIPVPPVLTGTPDAVTLGFVAGTHGQELLDAGHAGPVLRACGRILRRIHDLGFGHGDFGPNNVLLDPVTFEVTAVLDWEFSSTPVTDPVADLAWCEWIVRTHHPDRVPALPEFFEGYGTTVPWGLRHAAMLARCAELVEFTHRWDPGGPGEALWHRRLAVTVDWTGTP